MAELIQEPFPPGRYPLLLVGSGPGALQLTYSLGRLGIDHAVLSDDPAPGGMFRRWPVFQRMLSWTKPYSGFDHASRAYERFDWNSLLADEPVNRGVMPALMDGASYFPSRPEMERGLAAFAERTGLRVRFGCRWETTGRDGDDFVLSTTDGEYRAPVVVFAVGVAQPWKPAIPGIEHATQYGDLRAAETYADKRVDTFSLLKTRLWPAGSSSSTPRSSRSTVRPAALKFAPEAHPTTMSWSSRQTT